MRAVDRTFAILELLDDAERPLGLIEIEKQLGLPASSTAALLRALVEHGYLQHDRSTRTYAPTVRLANLGGWVATRSAPVPAIQRAMAEISERTGETVGLGYRNDIRVQYLRFHFVGESAFGIKPGTTRLLARSGLGWALLTFLSRRAVESIVRRTNTAVAAEDMIDAASLHAIVDKCCDGNHRLTPPEEDGAPQAPSRLLLNRRHLLKSTLILAAAFPAMGSTQQPWPSRPIKFVVPFAPGGGTDILARLLAKDVGETLGTPLIIENKPGMAASLGAGIVANSPPDGYTILMCTPGVQITNPYLYPKLPYDPEHDLTGVSLTGRLPNLLVVHPSLPVRSVGELVAYAKANLDELSYSSTGSGSTSHLACELFKSMAGIQMVHVPYKGSAPAMIDLVAGRVQVTIDSYTVLDAFVRRGSVRPIGISTQDRFPDQPDLPTIAESLPGFEGSSVIYVAAPAGTPRDVVLMLNNAFNVAMAKPTVAARLREFGILAVPGTPEVLLSVIAEERVKWKRVIEISGAKAES